MGRGTEGLVDEFFACEGQMFFFMFWMFYVKKTKLFSWCKRSIFQGLLRAQATVGLHSRDDCDVRVLNRTYVFSMGWLSWCANLKVWAWHGVLPDQLVEAEG